MSLATDRMEELEMAGARIVHVAANTAHASMLTLCGLHTGDGERMREDGHAIVPARLGVQATCAHCIESRTDDFVARLPTYVDGRPPLLCPNGGPTTESLAWISSQVSLGRHRGIWICEYVKPVFQLHGFFHLAVQDWNKHRLYHFTTRDAPQCKAVIEAMRKSSFWDHCNVPPRGAGDGEFVFEVEGRP